MGLSLVLCFAAQRALLGCVQGGKSLPAQPSDRLDLLTADGSSLAIRAHQVLLDWEEPAPPGGGEPTALVAFLASKSAWLEERAKRISLDTLAERLSPGRNLSLEVLAAMIAAEVSRTPWDQAALCLALLQDRERFKREGTGFVLLDREEQQKRRTRESQAREAERWTQLAQQWGPELERGVWSGGGSPDGPEFLSRLWSLAVHERHSPHWSILGKALGLHTPGETSVARRVKPWLVAGHAWRGWPAYWLEHAQVRGAFSPEALAEASRLAQVEAPSAKRADRRAEAVYTIDAAGTFDYDDAYCVEAAGQALFVNVHIAEPHPDLKPGHPVFDEAGLRMSSVYSEAGNFPMLPPALCFGRFSLLRGRVREAVTFRFRVTESGPEWIGVERSLVEVRGNLDYVRAAELVAEQEATWGRLARACEAHAQARAQRGAHVADRVDVQLDVSDPAQIGLLLKPRGGPVQRIVEELAVAYNASAGEFCRTHSLPALYRVQRKVPPARGEAKADRAQMAHARFSLQGGPHEGLACERYVQATSPNRRFLDLVMQRQIIAHASGRTVPFTREQLSTWGGVAEGRLAAYDEAERAIQEHYVRLYLQQHPDEQAPGIVRRVEEGVAKVWLEGFALTAHAPLSRRLEEGQRLSFRVVSVDLDQRRVQVEPV